MINNIEYIHCENEKEFIEIQKYLFKKGYKWRVDSDEIFITNKYPIMIVLEYDKKITYSDFGFSTYNRFKNISTKASYILNYLLRKEKINKLYK